MQCSDGTVKTRLFRGKINLELLIDSRNKINKNEVNVNGF